METGKTLEKKRKFELPHIFLLLFCIIVVCTIMTWVLPAGEFERVTEGGRTVVVPGTYHGVEQSPVGPFDMFYQIYNGFCDSADVSMFVFISYASINIIISSGAFNGLVAFLLKIFKGKSRLVIIPIFLTLVGAASSTIPLYPCFRGYFHCYGL